MKNTDYDTNITVSTIIKDVVKEEKFMDTVSVSWYFNKHVCVLTPKEEKVFSSLEATFYGYFKQLVLQKLFEHQTKITDNSSAFDRNLFKIEIEKIDVVNNIHDGVFKSEIFAILYGAFGSIWIERLNKELNESHKVHLLFSELHYGLCLEIIHFRLKNHNKESEKIPDFVKNPNARITQTLTLNTYKTDLWQLCRKTKDKNYTTCILNSKSNITQNNYIRYKSLNDKLIVTDSDNKSKEQSSAKFDFWIKSETVDLDDTSFLGFLVGTKSFNDILKSRQRLLEYIRQLGKSKKKGRNPKL